VRVSISKQGLQEQAALPSPIAGALLATAIMAAGPASAAADQLPLGWRASNAMVRQTAGQAGPSLPMTVDAGAATAAAGQVAGQPLGLAALASGSATGVDEGPGDGALSPQRTRFYFGVQGGAVAVFGGEIAPGVELADSTYGVSALLGLNIGRYVGVEIAADYFETDVDVAGVGAVAEYSAVNLIPQLRLRYPLPDDRMSLYLLGGVGLGITELNDKNPLAANPAAPRFTGADKDQGLIYALGGGFEYFVAENVSLSLDLKYTMQTAEISVDNSDREFDLDSFRAMAGARLYIPGPAKPAPKPPITTYGERPWWAFDPYDSGGYLALRVGPPGAAWLLEKEVDSAESLEFGGREGVVISGGIGYDWNRYLGFELAGDWHEHGISTFRADFDADTAVVEYGIWSLIPQLRVKYPLMGDRLVPYLIAGAGLGYTEVNDPADETARVGFPAIEGEEYGLAASLGTGLEYFIAENMALGVELKYVYQRPSIEVDGRSVDVNADSLFATAGVRLYY